MKVSKKAAARAALIGALEAQIAYLTWASKPGYGKSYWVEHRSALAVAKAALAAMPVPPTKAEIEAARVARLQAEAAAKAKRALLHAARVAGSKAPRESLVDIRVCLARKAKAVAQAKAWVETLQDRADAFAFAAQGDQESFGQAAEMAATRRNQAERELAALMATSAMAFWK